MTKDLGVFRGLRITLNADGSVSTGQGSAIRRDYELNGNFRNWLRRRGVVLP